MTAGRAVRSWLKRRASPVGSVVRTTAPAVVLTYDDGPHPDHTPQILDALDRASASATFFVLLTRTRRSPDLVREILARGHEVGLHGPDHRPLTDFTPVEVLRRTRDAKHELEDAVQRPVRWFRPPYGAQRPADWWAVRRSGLTTVLWSASTGDWREMEQDERVRRTLEQGIPGAIVLAHDNFASTQDGARPGTAPSVDREDLARRVLRGMDELGRPVVSLAVAQASGHLVREASFSRRAVVG